jgi:hypothetical protein
MAADDKDIHNADINTRSMALPSSWFEASGTWKTSPSRIAELAGQLAGGKAGDPVTETATAMESLAGNGLVSVGDVGDSPAGRTLAAAVQNTHSHVSTVYQAFIAEYEAAVELLRFTAKSHGSALEATDTSVHQTGADLPSPPSLPTLGSATSVSGRKGLD